MGKQANYLQIYLNTTEIRKCEKVLNPGKFYRSQGIFLVFVFSNLVDVLRNFAKFSVK